MDEELPRKASELVWYLEALGVRYQLAFLLVTCSSWYLIKVATRPGKSRHVALLAIVPLPALVGFVSVFDGLLCGLCCLSCCEPARWCELANIFSMALVGVQVGLWLTLPGMLASLVILLRHALDSNAPAS